jgi:hypothetical protein
MRRLVFVVATLALIGCGDGATAPARGKGGAATPAGGGGGAASPGGERAAATRPGGAAAPGGQRATTAAGGAASPRGQGPWATRRSAPRRPLRCPASSSTARWPSRVLRRSDGALVKLWGRRPRLAEVSATGTLLRQSELGARKPTDVRALACGRGDRLAAAWTEWLGDGRARLLLSLDGGPARVLDTAETPYDAAPIGDVALAYAPDGSLVVAYAVFEQVRAIRVTDRVPGEPHTLGPAFEITDVVADRDVVAWTTIDGGEERNERRRIYAVRGAGRPQLVQRAPKHVQLAMTGQPGTGLRLSVAANGRAALLWGVDRAEFGEYSVWAAEAPPDGRFKRPRRVSRDGEPGAVAIRSDGTVLAVFATGSELRARLHAPGRPFGARETITDHRVEPVAGFDRTRPRVEWRGGVSVRDG